MSVIVARKSVQNWIIRTLFSASEDFATDGFNDAIFSEIDGSLSVSVYDSSQPLCKLSDNANVLTDTIETYLISVHQETTSYNFP